MADTVRAWAEELHIPTYGVGRPERNPMFLEKRVYQGSSGVVYPYPVIDSVFDEKADQHYTALFLENRYLKIMILPELGGRVQMALDKTNDYHFVYYNRVIKPALVGLAGPWISGGIEFNWPQHHRPSTFSPLDWRITHNSDGSATVWCSEIEQMFFTKGMHSFTLHPDTAYLQIDVQLYNRTSEPQTFLWWANPAVHVNDAYQSVFPPDVHAVMDHGKRDVSTFPIATGTYYKVNYAPGTDISRYKNIPVPTSYMAYHSDFDFVGNYDHSRQAGMLHVANHHLVPGKKQWTWGTSEFGQAWDRQLTDADGPYIELMCGAFTDNQPDFSWIMPGEEKRFTQVFMPYKQIGPATNASKDAVVHFEVANQLAHIGVYCSAPRTVQVALIANDTAPAPTILWDTTVALSPVQVLNERISLAAAYRPTQLTVRVSDATSGQTLVEFTPLPAAAMPLPAPASPALAPTELSSNEALFLNGLHLEQYRHATYAPELYYEEALRRDPFDSRCNNALGLLLYRRGKFAEAEQYFRTAIARLTERNPNPYDGEPYYNLGLVLRMQRRWQDAFNAFYKAAWSAAWQDATFFELARLAARAGDIPQALNLVNDALRRNWSHHQARHLKIALLRHGGKTAAALAEVAVALDLDPMDIGVQWEQILLTSERQQKDAAGVLTARMATDIALDYMHAGLFDDAAMVLRLTAGHDPLMHYFLGYVLLEAGNIEEAHACFQQGANLSPAGCFPHRLESVLALEAAIRMNPQDARAPYYLGNFWYAHRRYAEAIACWEQATALDPTFPTVQRNLGLAYFNKHHDAERAAAAYARAFALDPTDARVLFELDQLEKKRNRTPAERLARLEAYPTLYARRDDLMIEYIALLNMLGRHADAEAALLARQFHPWEGGEGKTTGQYVAALLGQARAQLTQGAYMQALALAERALVYPSNLGEGKLPGAQENNVFYTLGCAYAGLGQTVRAQAAFERAAIGLSEPNSAMYYNDQPPDMIFYQGLARQQLGHTTDAIHIFQKLIDYGDTHMHDQVQMDYFAVSLPTFLVFDEDLAQRNQIHCHYMRALGHLGLGDMATARSAFVATLALDANHQGALYHQALAVEATL